MALVKKWRDYAAAVSTALQNIQQGKPEAASKQLVSLKKDRKIITALTALQPDMLCQCMISIMIIFVDFSWEL